MSGLSKLEERLFTRYFDDGLLDIFIGLAIGLIGIMWMIDLIALGAMVPVLLMPFWKPARQQFVETRVGNFTFKSKRKAANKSTFTKWIIFGLVILITEITFYVKPGAEGLRNSDLILKIVPALPAILIGILLTLISLYLKLGRFSFYGTLAVIFGFLATYDLGVEPGHTLLFTGVAILLIGYIHFLIFMRDNQVHDANDEQQSQSEEEYRES